MSAQLAPPDRWCIIEPFDGTDATRNMQTNLIRGFTVHDVIYFAVGITSGRPVIRITADERHDPIARLVGETTAHLAPRLEPYADKDGDLFAVSIVIWTEPTGYWKWCSECIFDGMKLPPPLDAIRRECQRAIERIIRLAVVAGEFP